MSDSEKPTTPPAEEVKPVEEGNNTSEEAPAAEVVEAAASASAGEASTENAEKSASAEEGSKSAEGEEKSGSETGEKSGETNAEDASGEVSPGGEEKGSDVEPEFHLSGGESQVSGVEGEELDYEAGEGGDDPSKQWSKNSIEAMKRELGSTVFKQEAYLLYDVTDKHSFAEYQLSDFADAFKMYDVMGDSMLSSAQLYKALQWLGEAPDDPDYQKALDKVDAEGTDLLSFQGMLDILALFSREPITELELLETFELMDQDRSGTIDAGELKRLMTCVGHALTTEESEKMIDEADADYSGEVDFDEFSHTILSSQY